MLQIDISESGVINEKRSSDAKLEELKEILSQKSIGVVGGYGMTESLPDNFKSTEVSSNSSGSKMAGSFSRNQVKVEGFDEKAQINMLANNYLEYILAYTDPNAQTPTSNRNAHTNNPSKSSNRSAGVWTARASPQPKPPAAAALTAPPQSSAKTPYPPPTATSANTCCNNTATACWASASPSAS